MSDDFKVWMPPKAPKLERLAKELETLEGRQEELTVLISHVRDNDYERWRLVEDLRNAHLGYFAKKLSSGYYDIFK